MFTSFHGITFVTLIKLLLVFIGHVSGVIGERIAIRDGASAPDTTYFYAHHGLWLLSLPVAWFVVALALMRANKNVATFVWLGVGAAIILYLAPGCLAAFMPLIRVTH